MPLINVLVSLVAPRPDGLLLRDGKVAVPNVLFPVVINLFARLSEQDQVLGPGGGLVDGVEEASPVLVKVRAPPKADLLQRDLAGGNYNAPSVTAQTIAAIDIRMSVLNPFS